MSKPKFTKIDTNTYISLNEVVEIKQEGMYYTLYFRNGEKIRGKTKQFLEENFEFTSEI